MQNNKPADITSRYFEYVRTQNVAGVVALFANDASYLMPDGRSFSGKDQIRDWFTKLFASVALNPRVVVSITSDVAMAVEIENILPNGELRNTANFFHFGATGLIDQLRVYQRS